MFHLLLISSNADDPNLTFPDVAFIIRKARDWLALLGIESFSLCILLSTIMASTLLSKNSVKWAPHSDRNLLIFAEVTLLPLKFKKTFFPIN